jgi:hypothetical protein
MNDALTRQVYNAFRAHSSEHHLRLHHAIYLQHLIAKTDEWRYSALSPWMRSTLNRFFELADRVALTTCKLESWDENEVERIVVAGENWIDSLSKNFLLQPRYPWGSAYTVKHWQRLEEAITAELSRDFSVIDLSGEDATPHSYEIFSGGFEYVPTVGLFPFYLFGERLGAWGIVKYGTLDSLAMATNACTLDQIRKRVSWNFDSLAWPGTVRAFDIRREKFTQLVTAARDSGTTLFYLGAGHAAVSLLLQVVEADAYRDFRKLIRPMGGTGQDASKGENAAINNLLKSNQHRGIVFCDLGDVSLANYLDPALDGPGDNRRLLVMSELRVPVGFGFSLAALPELLRSREAFEDTVRSIRDWAGGLTEDDRKKLKLLDGIDVAAAADIRSPWIEVTRNEQKAESHPSADGPH